MSTESMWWMFYSTFPYLLIWAFLGEEAKKIIKKKGPKSEISQFLTLLLKGLSIGGLVMALIFIWHGIHLIFSGYFFTFEWNPFSIYSDQQFMDGVSRNRRGGILLILLPIVFVLRALLPFFVIAFGCYGVSLYGPSITKNIASNSNQKEENR